MADSQSASQPQPEEMHWIALRMDVQEVCQDIRELRSEASDFRKEMAQQFSEVRAEASDFRKEMAQQFSEVRGEASDSRKEMAQQFSEVRGEAGDFRKEMAQHLGELRQDIRHSLMAMLGFSGVLTAIMIAFIQYRLGGN
jgi:uncharacterized coiled-coil DUF342 family protein